MNGSLEVFSFLKQMTQRDKYLYNKHHLGTPICANLEGYAVLGGAYLKSLLKGYAVLGGA